MDNYPPPIDAPDGPRVDPIEMHKIFDRINQVPGMNQIIIDLFDKSPQLLFFGFPDPVIYRVQEMDGWKFLSKTPTCDPDGKILMGNSYLFERI